MKEKVINSVESRPALWDRRHKHHHNRHVLEKEWKTIGEELKTSDKTVKQIWKYLRQEFRKQFNKTLESGAGTQYEDINWKYYNRMLFLHDQFTPQKSTGNLAVAVDEGEYSTNEDEDRNITELLKVEVCSPSVINSPPEAETLLLQTTATNLASTDNRYTQQHSYSPGVTRPIDNNMRDNVYSPRFKKRINIQSTVGQELVQIEKDKLILKQNRVGDNRNDEDVDFFNSLLPHVTALTSRQKMLFRMKIQEVLFEIAYPPEYSIQPPSSTTVHRAPPEINTASNHCSQLSLFDTSSSSSSTPPAVAVESPVGIYESQDN